MPSIRKSISNLAERIRSVFIRQERNINVIERAIKQKDEIDKQDVENLVQEIKSEIREIEQEVIESVKEAESEIIEGTIELKEVKKPRGRPRKPTFYETKFGKIVLELRNRYDIDEKTAIEHARGLLKIPKDKSFQRQLNDIDQEILIEFDTP